MKLVVNGLVFKYFTLRPSLMGFVKVASPMGNFWIERIGEKRREKRGECKNHLFDLESREENNKLTAPADFTYINQKKKKKKRLKPLFSFET